MEEEYLSWLKNLYHLQLRIEIDSPSEAIWVLSHPQNSRDIILGAFYAPPNSPSLIWDELTESLTQIRHQFPTLMLIMGGDFRGGLDIWFTAGLL